MPHGIYHTPARQLGNEHATLPCMYGGHTWRWRQRPFCSILWPNDLITTPPPTYGVVVVAIALLARRGGGVHSMNDGGTGGAGPPPTALPHRLADGGHPQHGMGGRVAVFPHCPHHHPTPEQARHLPSYTAQHFFLPAEPCSGGLLHAMPFSPTPLRYLQAWALYHLAVSTPLHLTLHTHTRTHSLHTAHTLHAWYFHSLDGILFLLQFICFFGQFYPSLVGLHTLTETHCHSSPFCTVTPHTFYHNSTSLPTQCLVPSTTIPQTFPFYRRFSPPGYRDDLDIGRAACWLAWRRIRWQRPHSVTATVLLPRRSETARAAASAPLSSGMTITSLYWPSTPQRPAAITQCRRSSMYSAKTLLARCAFHTPFHYHATRPAIFPKSIGAFGQWLATSAMPPLVCVIHTSFSSSSLTSWYGGRGCLCLCLSYLAHACMCLFTILTFLYLSHL